MAAGHGIVLEPGEPDRKVSLDDGFPPGEKLPRRMEVVIEDREGRAFTTLDGVPYGDPLTDNNYEDDGYRFHDVFHLAYAAVLGWSPVVRALTGRRRKSIPRVAALEDGRRAITLDEGIVALTFSYARGRNFLEGAGGIDDGILRIIKEMTWRLEVSTRTAADWERAIILGFDVWRRVRAQGGGTIHVDLDQGTMELSADEGR